MTVAYSLTPRLRNKLKEPIGVLIRGSFSETMKRLEAMVNEKKPPIVISVGDTVTRNLAKSDIRARLMIVDNVCMRRTIEKPVQIRADRTVRIKNPQATITTEAMEAVKESLEGDATVKIAVDGEEDLLVLIAVLYAPEGSFVLYGQPYEGIVVVKATPEKKTEVANILNEMKAKSES